MLRSIYTFDAGARAKACAQGLAAIIFNADESDKFKIVDAGSRYEGTTVSIVIEPEDDSLENRKTLLDALIASSDWVIDAAKNGFDGESAEEMLNVFSYPDEGTAFYSNVKGKTDLTVEDLENLKAELVKARSGITESTEQKSQMTLEEACSILKASGKKIAIAGRV